MCIPCDAVLSDVAPVMVDATGRAELEISYVDDPRVVKEAATEDYSTHVVPR